VHFHKEPLLYSILYALFGPSSWILQIFLYLGAVIFHVIRLATV